MAIDPETVRYLVSERGTQVTFRRTSSTYDPSSGTTTDTTDDETVNAVFTQYRLSEVDGSNIQRGDRKVLMSAFQTNGSALSKSPKVNDEIVGQGQTVSVVNSQQMQDAGVTVAWVLQVRS